MSDITERLRQYVTHGGKVYESDAEEAADEIERLRAVELKYTNLCGVLNEQTAEIERLRGLLREARSIASDPYTAEYALTAALARIDAALHDNSADVSVRATVQPSGTD